MLDRDVPGRDVEGLARLDILLEASPASIFSSPSAYWNVTSPLTT
jgi:hypothetical protein